MRASFLTLLIHMYLNLYVEVISLFPVEFSYSLESLENFSVTLIMLQS